MRLIGRGGGRHREGVPVAKFIGDIQRGRSSSHISERNRGRRLAYGVILGTLAANLIFQPNGATAHAYTCDELSPGSVATSGYGARGGGDHKGLDCGHGSGAPIAAAEDGVVTYAGAAGGYGNLVVVQSGNRTIKSGHMQAIHVKEGDTIEKGQHIADVGSLGDSTGPHLHTEVLIDGVHVDPETVHSDPAAMPAAPNFNAEAISPVAPLSETIEATAQNIDPNFVVPEPIEAVEEDVTVAWQDIAQQLPEVTFYQPMMPQGELIPTPAPAPVPAPMPQPFQAPTIESVTNDFNNLGAELNQRFAQELQNFDTALQGFNIDLNLPQ